MESDQAKKIFLLSTIVLGVFVVLGLVWAVSAELGGDKKTLSFNDDNDPIMGPGEAKVVVRIFSDFQCPACQAAEAGLKYAMDTYKDQVRFVWNDFPLQALHANALRAAEAARCAEVQGKFWEYRERLFADQAAWENLPDPLSKFRAYADALGLDANNFSSCLDSREYQNKIMDDLREGQANGVQATPIFFVGDKALVGAQDNDVWDREIQQQLTAQ
jgi:protein-disulfide isomerase